MTFARKVLFVVGVAEVLGTINVAAQTTPRFEPHVNRVLTGLTEPARRALRAAEKAEEEPLFDVTARASIAFDDDNVSPLAAFGYSDLRSETHPWWTELGYKRIDKCQQTHRQRIC